MVSTLYVSVLIVYICLSILSVMEKLVDRFLLFSAQGGC